MSRKTTTPAYVPHPGERVAVTWTTNRIRGTVEEEVSEGRWRVRLHGFQPRAVVPVQFLEALPDDPGPEIPDWLAGPLGRHDAGLCGCDGETACVAGLWDDKRITTEEARERLCG